MALVLALTSLSADNATTAAAAVAPASPSSSIPLVSFASGADPKLKHKWEALNDPVMGGQSTSTSQIHPSNSQVARICRACRFSWAISCKLRNAI